VVDRIRQIEALLLRSRRLPWVLLSVVLGVLAGVIALTARPVRDSTRLQMIHRAGEILHPVVVWQLGSMASGDLAEDPADPASQLAVLLSVERPQGVLGIRLFGADGRFVESVPLLVEQDVAPEHLAMLARLEPVSQFEPRVSLNRHFYPETMDELTHPVEAPLLEVYVPLHLSGQEQLLGVAQFVMDGATLAEEFRRLDRRLWLQGGATFLVAGMLVTVASAWAFRRLHRLHRQLAVRTESLLQANAELGLAARTTALGAIASHLVHGLRSPLAGLQNLVTAGREEPNAPGPEDWEQAAASMRRMQTLISEVVEVLREHPEGDRYRVSLEEVAGQVDRRAASMVGEHGVELQILCSPPGWLDNRAANLVTLILLNLVQNGLEATRPGGRVCLTVTRTAGGVACRVSDEGDGLPDAVRKQLFKPMASTKEGGSGLGLAISRQLALHLNAKLELIQSAPSGSLFELLIPVELVHDSEDRGEARLSRPVLPLVNP
jgi:signal transduction histidine kinase